MKTFARIAVGIVAAIALATGAVAAAAAVGNPPPPPRDSTQARQAGPDQSSALAAASTGAGSEQLFVPISPCRIVDTRAAGGKLAASETRSFYVGGTTGFTGQGGASAGCGIPAGATGASISLTSTQSGGAGRIIAFPAGIAAPNSTMLSYTSASNVTSTPTVTLRPGADRHLSVKNYSTTTHLVIDVLGYYVSQMSAVVDPSGGMYAGSRVVGTGRIDVGQYAVEFDTDITDCSGVGSSDDTAVTVSVYPSEKIAYLYLFDANGQPVDDWSDLVVIC
ncbi:hypothetical protein [Microbacterium sp. E-13]|uniref:hypothetical protein n=1 Tax=Microbacterium sp. E-13 TaxID=3404048 RepID=UPI003CECDEF6